ncbi:MAG: hypothetical protein O3B86_16755, partial [Planctomycetota bacterium]|nr:hypothetical protein [Planctomycetota bacterium]
MTLASSGSDVFLPPLFAALDERTRKLVQQAQDAEHGQRSQFSGGSGRSDDERSPTVRSPRTRRLLLWLLGVFLAVAGTASLISLNIASSRVIYIVNGSTAPLHVSIDGGSDFEIPAISKRRVTLAEGLHRWSISRPAAAMAEGQFSLRTGFFERLNSSPMFVLDPAGTAVTVQETAEYAIDSANGRVTHRFHIGEEFYSFA